MKKVEMEGGTLACCICCVLVAVVVVALVAVGAVYVFGRCCRRALLLRA